MESTSKRSTARKRTRAAAAADKKEAAGVIDLCEDSNEVPAAKEQEKKETPKKRSRSPAPAVKKPKLSVSPKKPEEKKANVEDDSAAKVVCVTKEEVKQDKAHTEVKQTTLCWTKPYPTMHYFGCDSMPGSEKIAAFDMDQCLIEPKSGAKFPKTRGDWKWLYTTIPEKLKQLHQEGVKIVIFSNQGGVANGKQKLDDITGKLQDMQKQLGVPLHAFIATGNDKWRKPSPAMWHFFVSNCNGGVKPSLGACIYVGDAAGRQKGWCVGGKADHSDSDRAFAHNIGIDFKTPEEFFKGHKPAAFKWSSPDPDSWIKQAANKSPCPQPIACKTQEMILCVGFPASGKSSFCKRYLIPEGYVHVNRDTLNTQSKCMKAVSEALEKGKSVVVDNTNPDLQTRAQYIELSKSSGIPVRCFWFQTPRELADHLNLLREKTAGVKHIPAVAFNMFKSRFKEPTVKEGFQSVVKVDWTPCFDSEEQKRFFLERT